MIPVNCTDADRQFLAEVIAYIERHISKQVITLAMIADSLQMSHVTIHKKIRFLTGLSGSEFILKVRLQHSLQQMVLEHRNMSEYARESGFKDVSHFRNCFKDEYGMTPAEYLNRQQVRSTIKWTIKMGLKQNLIDFYHFIGAVFRNSSIFVARFHNY